MPFFFVKIFKEGNCANGEGSQVLTLFARSFWVLRAASDSFIGAESAGLFEGKWSRICLLRQQARRSSVFFVTG